MALAAAGESFSGCRRCRRRPSPPCRDSPLWPSLMQFRLSLAGLLTWMLFRRSSGSGSGSSSSSSGLSGTDGGPPCPLVFRRPSLDELREGAMPYLLGGPQQPACTNCRRSGEWAEICQFKAGPLCSQVGCGRRLQLPAHRQRSCEAAIPSQLPCRA